jgi:hypothetical protein
MCAHVRRVRGLFDLTDREKANNLKMLDDEAAHAVQAGN